MGTTDVEDERTVRSSDDPNSLGSDSNRTQLKLRFRYIIQQPSSCGLIMWHLKYKTPSESQMFLSLKDQLHINNFKRSL